MGVAGCGPSLPGLGDVPASTLDAGPGRDPLADAPPNPPALDASSTWRAVPPDAGTRVDAALGAGRDGAPDLRVSDAARDGGGDLKGAADVAADASVDRIASARAPRHGELVIAELLIDPVGNDLGHEWIEIANVAAESLDLSGLHLSDGDVDVAVNAGVLPAAGRLVLGQSTDRGHNGDAPVDFAYGTRLSLNNGADQISVCLGACAGGVTLSSFAWTEPFGDAYVGHAVVVEPDGATCPAGDAYGTGGNFGSPGRPNMLCERTKLAPPSLLDGGPPADAIGDR